MKWFKLLFIAAVVLSVAWVGYEANAATSFADVIANTSNPGTS